jgi:FkbM family methyltransferase
MTIQKMTLDIKKQLKYIIRESLMFCRIDLTKNLKYDRLSKIILNQIMIKKDCNALDIGAHDGDFLKLFLKNSPSGKHVAFEPLPHKFDALVKNFGATNTVYSCALSNYEGTDEFCFVKNAEAYSGLKNRRYDVENPIIEKIKVNVRTLDSLNIASKIDFIKIDVEGGEYDALRGGIKLLQRDKPFLLFEYGTGASDFYHTTSKAMYEFLCTEIGYSINTLDGYINDALSPLSFEEFNHYYTTGDEYYFVASVI